MAKYKIGDKVRIKSLDWYNENKDEYGYIDCGSRAFFTKMSDWCGKIATIKEICKTNCYRLEEYDFDWTDEMIEGLVEEEVEKKLSDESWRYKDVFDHSQYPQSFECPDGYQFKDENGIVINTQKIVLEKKKKEYPKTYEECSKVLLERASVRNDFGYKANLLVALQKLLVCRDAYWKIAGEEMGLGKPWEPDWNIYEHKFCLGTDKDKVIEECVTTGNRILAFPTPEMRDTFKENFNPDIEICKELL